MAPNPIAQKAATGLLVYAAYMTAVCPCRKLMGCHKKEFYLSVAAAVAIVARENMT